MAVKVNPEVWNKIDHNTGSALEHLGFSVDSIKMTIELNVSKKQKILNLCQKVLKCNIITIRQIAELIGILVSSLPGVEFSKLFY